MSKAETAPSEAPKAPKSIILKKEKHIENQVLAEERTAALKEQGLDFVALPEGMEVAVFRIDGRPGSQIIEDGGFNPWNMGEGIRVISPTNIPDHLRQHGQLILNEDFDLHSGIGKEGGAVDPTLAEHALDKRIPSNPGANMGINCWATNPYGGLSAAGEPGATRWIAVAAANRGIPITSLYQTQEMLSHKISHLEEEARGEKTEKIITAFDAYGKEIFNVPVTVKDKNGASKTVTVPLSEDGQLLKEDWKKFDYCVDKNGLAVGKMENMQKSSTGELTSADVVDKSGKKIGTYENGKYKSNDGSSMDVTTSTVWAPETVRVECNEKNIDDFVKAKLGRDAPLEPVGITPEALTEKVKTLPHEKKPASFEFEFSDYRRGLESTLMFVEIECVSGSSYKVKGAKVNPYFNADEHPIIYGDKHLDDLLKACESPGSTVTVSPKEIVTPLQEALVTRHLPETIMDMEGVTRDKAELGKKIKGMKKELGSLDVGQVKGVEPYSTKKIVSKFAMEQSKTAEKTGELIKAGTLELVSVKDTVGRLGLVDISKTKSASKEQGVSASQKPTATPTAKPKLKRIQSSPSL